jgi:hypothetical protein
VPRVAGRLDRPRRRAGQLLELVSATVGGAAEPATQPPTTATCHQPAKQDPNQNHLPIHAPGDAKAMAPQSAAGERPASMILLYIRIVLFGFVGTQLAWTLRPFFGRPGAPFELFRDIDATFYGDILRTLSGLFS